MAEEEMEDDVRKKIVRATYKDGPDCRPRIDILALPKKSHILSLWLNHAQRLPKDKIENVRELLQELYAMTPEETEKYFAQLRQAAQKAALRRKLKLKLRKILMKRKKCCLRSKAYCMFGAILRSGIEYALKNSVPPLVSIRLRNLSDIILEQLCDLRDVPVPNRSDPDRLGLLLITISDWISIAVQHLYYTIKVKNDEELARLDAEERERLLREQEEQRKRDQELLNQQPFLEQEGEY